LDKGVSLSSFILLYQPTDAMLASKSPYTLRVKTKHAMNPQLAQSSARQTENMPIFISERISDRSPSMFFFVLEKEYQSYTASCRGRTQQHCKRCSTTSDDYRMLAVKQEKSFNAVQLTPPQRNHGVGRPPKQCSRTTESRPKLRTLADHVPFLLGQISWRHKRFGGNP